MKKPNQDNDTEPYSTHVDNGLDEVFAYLTMYEGKEQGSMTDTRIPRFRLEQAKAQIKAHYISRDKVREAIDSSEKVWKGKPADRFDEKGMYTKTTELREKLGL